MGRSKGTPERSKLVRGKAPAFSRRQRGGPQEPSDPDAKTEKPAETPGEKSTEALGRAETAPTATSTEETMTEGTPLVEAADVETQPISTHSKELPAIDLPAPGAEPWPDATPQPMKPVARDARPHTETVPGGVPTLSRPPEMPTVSAPPPLVLGDVENPAHMPAPREVPSGNPEDPAPPPGHVPPGDSRSLRRADEFALIYRVGTCVICRTGKVGTRGQWRVVEYPTSSSAASSYAKECSRFVSEGFSDYRD